MKARDRDLAEAQRLIHTYDRAKEAGLILTVRCFNHEHRRIAYIAQEAIIEYAPKPTPRPKVGFAYKGAK
jgi:hypothetical protein